MIHYPKHILIVEDNKADLRLLKDILVHRLKQMVQGSGRVWPE
jgi:CheY-like chemotaxis protein